MGKQRDPNKGKFIAKPVNNFDIDLTQYIKQNTPDNEYTTGSSNDYVDYTKSSYDPFQISKEDIPVLNSIRSENQGFFATAGNAIGRAALNIIPTVIGNTASILDFEDYFNQDQEVGNSITAAMEELKQSVNQDLFPIFRKNPEKSLDYGDSAWWLENGGGLLESIGAFAITGAGLGSAFSYVGKGLSLIKGLSQFGQAGKVAATILSSTALNQAESITTAMQVFDTIKQKGGSDQDAADAASYSININRANIALNLTSAGAFIRSPKMTRQVREAFKVNSGKILGEGIQEYAEETINLISQKEGERFGEAKIDKKKYKYDVENSINDALSAEGFESGLLGFIGGAGQTGLTKVYNKITGEDDKQNNLYSQQQESLNKIKGLTKEGVIPNINAVFKTIEQQSLLQNQINDSIKNGNNGKAKELQYQLLNNQLSDSLQNGNVDALENIYTNISNLTTEQAKAKGLDTDVNSVYNYKRKAEEAIQLIKDVEEGYLDIQSKNLLNFDEVLTEHLDNKVLNRLSLNLNGDYAKIRTTLLSEALNAGVNTEIDFSNPSEDIKNLPSYDSYLEIKTILEEVQSTIKISNKKIKNISSREYQQDLLNKELTKTQELLIKNQQKDKDSAAKIIKDNQNKTKEKVESVEAKKDKIAETVSKDNVKEITLKNGKTYKVNLTNNTVVSNESDNILNSNDKLAVQAINKAKTVIEPTSVATDTEVVNEEETVLPVVENQPVNNVKPIVTEELNNQEIITEEETAVATIVNSNEVIETNKQEIKQDGLVRNSTEVEAIESNLKFSDKTFKRTAANTIISLNIDYVETILGNISNQTNEKDIYDQLDDDGNVRINKNFDSRLQDPKQFNEGTEVRIIFPTYEQIKEKGIEGNYSIGDYTASLDNLEEFPIAFVDSEGGIIGFLPTTSNVRKRVKSENLDSAIIANQSLRQQLNNNKDNDNITVKITSKSTGAPIFNKKSKSIYKALGDGKSLSEGVEIAVVKDGKIMIGLDEQSSKKLANDKLALEEGVVYSITPTGDNKTSHIIPMNVERLNENQAKTVLKLIQLAKANTEELINERNSISNEINLEKGFDGLNKALENIIYTDTRGGKYHLSFNKTGLTFGLSENLQFSWDDVMTNTLAQEKILELLGQRFNAVKLSNFGKPFQHIMVDSNNKIQFIQHDNYLDYINQSGVIKTNLQGQKISNSDNLYFTAQSVIEISNPIIKKDNKVERVQYAEEVLPAQLNSSISEAEKQKKLEQDVEDIKSKIKDLRSEDGSIPADKMQEFNELKRTQNEAFRKAQRGNTKSSMLVKMFKDDVDKATSDPVILSEENKTEAADIIEQVIQISKSAEEASKNIQKLGYVFNVNDKALLNLYLKDRFDSNTPKIGNNKDSFQSWVNGKEDVTLLTSNTSVEEVLAAQIESKKEVKEVEEVIKPKNSMRAQYTPKKSTNRTQIDEDFSILHNKTIEEQAKELENNCK